VKKKPKNNSLILYLGQKWAPIEMNGKNCNLEHSKKKKAKIGDSKVTSSLGFSSKNISYIENSSKKHKLHRKYGTF